MKQSACLFLAIIRDANRKCVSIPQDITDILVEQIECAYGETLTDQNFMEIGELLKADTREKYATHPRFAEINAILEAFPKL